MLPSEFPEVRKYPYIQQVFEKQVDLLFVDLRCMFKAPLPGCVSGFNLTIATVILNLFAGFSRRLYRPIRKLDDGPRFTTMLVEFFPWDESPIKEKQDRSSMLYKAIRNPLTHELGIKGSEKVFLTKNGRSSDEEIKELEDSPSKPACLGQIIAKPQGLTWHVSTTGLYWGTHRLLHKLLASEHAERAESRFKKLLF